jgi:hypothetical protein
MVLIIALLIPLIIPLLRNLRTRYAARSASAGTISTGANTNQPTVVRRTRQQATSAEPAYSSYNLCLVYLYKLFQILCPICIL